MLGKLSSRDKWNNRKLAEIFTLRRRDMVSLKVLWIKLDVVSLLSRIFELCKRKK